MINSLVIPDLPLQVDGLKQQVEDAYNRPKTAKPVQPQSNVDKQLVKRLANEASLLHQSYHKLRMEVDQGFGDCAKLLQTVCSDCSPVFM